MRLSTVSNSIFMPALKVLSTILPLSTFLMVVRTKAGPLPGLTCWNFVTVHSWPSRFRTDPFLMSLVVCATVTHLFMFSISAKLKNSLVYYAIPSIQRVAAEQSPNGIFRLHQLFLMQLKRNKQ